MNVNFTLLRYHVLRDDIQIREGLVHKGGYIVSPLQNLGVDIRVNEVEELIKNLLDIRNLV